MKTQEDKLRVLAETKLYYSENPLRRCNDQFGCFYSGSRNKRTESDGCAIGRLLPKELAEEIDLKYKYNNNESGIIHIFHLIPSDIQEYGKSFLIQLQMLHDSDSCWTESGISKRGEELCSEIIAKIHSNQI